MKNSKNSRPRSTRLAWTLALLIGGILAAGTATADNPGKGGKNDRDDHRNGQREAQRGNHSGGGKDEHHFDDRHRALVRDYYVQDSHGGRCPPGLAKKQNGCMPPGQARKWNIGRPLPRDVVYYSVPQPLVVQIGQPPSGYRYVRVASDILMIAIGSGLVVDAIQDLGR